MPAADIWLTTPAHSAEIKEREQKFNTDGAFSCFAFSWLRDQLVARLSPSELGAGVQGFETRDSLEIRFIGRLAS